VPDIQPRRSVLYVPADRPRAIARALTLAADVLIFDLEDAVLPKAKEGARESLREALAEPFDAEIVVRINGLDTEWATEDILAAIAVRPDAILVPKVSGSAPLKTLAEALEQADAIARTSIWAMIETPLALLHLAEIAAVADDPAAPLNCFIIGANDLSLATRVPVAEGRVAFVPWFMQIVAAARAHGLAVIDAACNDIADTARLEAECRQAKALGMDGKTLIHPDQIAPANRILAPTAEECAWASRIVDAFAQPQHRDEGVIALDGRMVERLHLVEAEHTLALAAAIRLKERG
jgi:citrate lyase subunit beta / citryl-CoA lyase